MTLIVDSGPLVALGDRRDPRQGDVEAALRTEVGSLVVPEPVATEVDYLLGKRGGSAARQAFLEDVARGRFLVECVAPDDYGVVLELARQFVDSAPGLADLSIVVLAARYQTVRIATFDERDFRVLRPLVGGPAFHLILSTPEVGLAG